MPWIPVIGLVLSIAFGFMLWYGCREENDFCQVLGGIGLAFSVLIGLLIMPAAITVSHRVEYVPRPHVFITKTPKAVIIESDYGRIATESISEYQAADTAQGAWYIHNLNSWGSGADEHPHVTLIDPTVSPIGPSMDESQTVLKVQDEN